MDASVEAMVQPRPSLSLPPTVVAGVATSWLCLIIFCHLSVGIHTSHLPSNLKKKMYSNGAVNVCLLAVKLSSAGTEMADSCIFLSSCSIQVMI